MEGKHLPWHLPLSDWCIGAAFLFATTGAVILGRFLIRRWRSWRTEQFLARRSALATSGTQKLTTHDKQELKKKVRQSETQRLEKSFAFQGNMDLYVAIGLFGLAMLALVVLAVANGFHKHGGPLW